MQLSESITFGTRSMEFLFFRAFLCPGPGIIIDYQQHQYHRVRSSIKNSMQNLALTMILDFHGSRQWRSCGKLWVASLLRHQWGGRIHLERNFPQPLFPVARLDLQESEFPARPGRTETKLVNWKAHSRGRQLEVATMVTGVEKFDWVLLADADCVALRNPDHLFVGNNDVLVSMTGGLPDPGFFAVRGGRVLELAKELRAIGGLTTAGLASVIRSGGWTVREFERGEVLRPNDPGVSLSDLAHGAVIHFAGMKPEEKHRLAFAFHMMAVYGDGDGLFFDMMEA